MNLSGLQQFYRGFWIDDPVGNNAFSFGERRCRKIFVPPLVNGTADDLAVGADPAFVEIVEGEERACPGLRNFIRTDMDGKPVFIFDNHNHAFFFWLAALEQGVIRKGAVLVHVDQHRDTREPGVWLAPETQDPVLACGSRKGQGTRHKTQEGQSGCANGPSRSCVLCPVSSVFDYTNNILNVGNFIPPALKLGIFREVIHVDSPEGFRKDLPEQFVLDIDLDIFAPIMSYIPESLKIETLRAWSRRASLVTMATSPFFVDQALAIEYAKKVLSGP